MYVNKYLCMYVCMYMFVFIFVEGINIIIVFFLKNDYFLKF